MRVPTELLWLLHHWLQRLLTNVQAIGQALGVALSALHEDDAGLGLYSLAHHVKREHLVR